MSFETDSLPPRTRSRVMLLTLLGIVMIGLLGIASMVDRDAGAIGATSTNVKILAKKTFKSNVATNGEDTRVLFKTGGVRHRATCTDVGGELTVLVQARSTRNGGYLALEELSIPFNLTSAWKNVASLKGFGSKITRRSYDTLFKDGTFRHFDLVIGIGTHGRKCTARLVATSG